MQIGIQDSSAKMHASVVRMARERKSSMRDNKLRDGVPRMVKQDSSESSFSSVCDPESIASRLKKITHIHEILDKSNLQLLRDVIEEQKAEETREDNKKMITIRTTVAQSLIFSIKIPFVCLFNREKYFWSNFSDDVWKLEQSPAKRLGVPI